MTIDFGTAFQIEDVEYTIESIKPAESDYPDHGIHNGIMYVDVAYAALEDGAEPDLIKCLTMYDSSGRSEECVLPGTGTSLNDGVEYFENSIGELKAGATGMHRIMYGYDYDEPYYELEVSYGNESTSLKFAIDQDTGTAVVQAW